MTQGEVNEISRAIGAVEATVAQLLRMWEHNDREATEGRRMLHKKFEELKDATTDALSTIRNQVTQINGRVDSIASELAIVKPDVVTVNNERQQAIGSKKLLALIWAALIGLVGATAGAAVEIVHLLWPKAH